jgi:G:T-mismatch repair DNA endonuclease (very short patch repair protein)
VHAKALKKLGWRVLVVWECETENARFAEKAARRFAALIKPHLREKRGG